ncbi:MAG: ABC transporter permease [Burkholderiales bacterium]|nr:ABC transporter permease [Burkholderiales bacterium]
MRRYALPLPSLRFVAVWRRNLLVWRKLAVASVLGNIADPMIALVAFGYGLGALLPSVEGVAYVQYLAAGTICMSAMNAATFEALYSAFSRMHVQRTWDGIMNASVDLDDIVLGELAWAATKALMSGVAIIAVAACLGLAHGYTALFILPVTLLAGLAFAAIGLVFNALARGYDFFTYYFTLVVTPMSFMSGVFFPVAQLPPWLAQIAGFLPLTHAVDLVRPLLLGKWPPAPALNVAVLATYAAGATYCALVLTRRRLLA